MKRISACCLAMGMFVVFFFSTFSAAQVLMKEGRPEADIQIILPDQGFLAYNPMCTKPSYLATNDQNQKKTGPEDNNAIEPQWQMPAVYYKTSNYPLLDGVYKFKVLKPECSDVVIRSDVGNNYVLSERLMDYYHDSAAVNLMMKKGYTAEKLVPQKEGEKYYYILTAFYRDGDLKNVPADPAMVGHLVPDRHGFLSDFVKAGESRPALQFYPYVRVMRVMKRK